jgi:hypothetical protein
VRNEGQLDRAGVDREPVPPEPDRPAVVAVQVEAVAQRPPGLLAGGLDPALQLLGADAVVEGAQLLGDPAEPRDHRVGGEVGVDLVRRPEGRGAAADAGQDAVGRLGEPVGAAGALVQERLLAGRERLVDLGALRLQLGEEVVQFAEPGLQRLQAEEQPAELLVAALRRGRAGEGARDGLVEQAELGGELGAALASQQVAAPVVQDGAGPVEAAEDLADALQDRGPRGRVGQVEVADDPGDDLQALVLRVEKVGEAVPIACAASAIRSTSAW